MIEINNLTKVRVDEKFLEKIIKDILKNEGVESIELSVALAGEKRIRELNKLYREKDKATDVLSFIYDNIKEYKGEIVLCLEQINKNAKMNNSSFKKELSKVLIHGVLHILGYEHEAGKEKAELMQQKENYYLSQLK